jgi:hypothetical protein
VTQHDETERGGELTSAAEGMAGMFLRPEVKARLEAARQRVEAEGDTTAYETTAVPELSPEDEHKAMVRRREALMKALPARRQALGCADGLTALDAGGHPEKLQAFLDDPAASTLLLIGPTGSGKTHAGYALLAQAARYGAVMRHPKKPPERRRLLVGATLVDDYVWALQPDGHEDPPWKVRKDHAKFELLLLDDLGAELDSAASMHVRRVVSALLNKRLEDMHRQVITLNGASEVLARRLGDRLWSRLNEEAHVVEFRGRDRRMRSGGVRW